MSDVPTITTRYSCFALSPSVRLAEPLSLLGRRILFYLLSLVQCCLAVYGNALRAVGQLSNLQTHYA